MKSLRSLVAWTFLTLSFSVSVASAEPDGRVYKIGWLWLGSWGFEPQPIERWGGPGGTFRESLQAAGYVAGKNFVIDRRHASGEADRLSAVARELAASDVDVIVTQGALATFAAMQATKRIPIIFFGTSYPVERGMVANFARPGGNVTGMAVTNADATQWRLLREVAPTVRRAGRLENAANRPADEHYAAYRASMFEQMKADAAAVGIEPIRMGVFGFDDIDPLFADLARRGDAGVVVINDPILASPDWRPSIMEMAVRYRLPTSCARDRAWAQSGCLATYTEDWDATMRSLAAQVAKILSGTKPGDIPVGQSTTHRLIINAKTAKALGLTLPPSLLARADEVIE